MDFEPKMPEGGKNMVDVRKRWGSSVTKMKTNNGGGPNAKESIDEFDSILDGLGSSTNSFNKRVSIHKIFNF